MLGIQSNFGTLFIKYANKIRQIHEKIRRKKNEYRNKNVHSQYYETDVNKPRIESKRNFSSSAKKKAFFFLIPWSGFYIASIFIVFFTHSYLYAFSHRQWEKWKDFCALMLFSAWNNENKRRENSLNFNNN